MLQNLIFPRGSGNFFWNVHTRNTTFLPNLDARFQNLGEMMTLGRSDAAISPSFVEGLTLEGPIGHTGKLAL